MPETRVKPHPAAWQAALTLAGGDPHRLTVTDERTVWVDGPVVPVAKPVRRTRRPAQPKESDA